MKMKVFYAEKHIEELTVATGLDEDHLKGLDNMVKNNIEQSVKIEELQTEVNERNEIISTCNKHIASLEREVEELRRSGELTAAERESQAQAAAIEATTAAATVAEVLKELQDLQLDHSSLMERAANAEAELSSTREMVRSARSRISPPKGRNRAPAFSVPWSRLLPSRRPRKRSCSSGTVSTPRYTRQMRRRRTARWPAREAAVREELGAREAIAAGSLEAKVQALMDAEVRRRDEHARALDAARAEVLAAREETAAAERATETARAGRRQAAVDVERLEAQCAREVQVANESREKAMRGTCGPRWKRTSASCKSRRRMPKMHRLAARTR